MSVYDQVQARLKAQPASWLVTGVAGFIGSNLLQRLLDLGQQVVGLDNYSTGNKKNLEEVRATVGREKWSRFRTIEGDILDPAVCQRACVQADYVLHLAALGSVPRSLAEPIACHENNVTGFLNLLLAARDAKVQRFVFASSSAVYGDAPDLPKIEQNTGRPLSPYAASKAMNELYAAAFASAYGFSSIGLRYFNVFGPRQDPEGAYAAVIPKWISALLHRQPVYINGDGETSRDFCFIENVLQANLLAATVEDPQALDQVYNIAVGTRTTLNELFAMLQACVQKRDPGLPTQAPVYRDFRPGDVRHSLADIGKAQRLLGYTPSVTAAQGIEVAMDWYVANTKHQTPNTR